MEHILNERVRLFPLFLAERSIKDEVDIGWGLSIPPHRLLSKCLVVGDLENRVKCAFREGFQLRGDIYKHNSLKPLQGCDRENEGRCCRENRECTIEYKLSQVVMYDLLFSAKVWDMEVSASHSNKSSVFSKQLSSFPYPYSSAKFEVRKASEGCSLRTILFQLYCLRRAFLLV